MSVRGAARRPLIVTPGMGIGPEVTLRALAETGWSDLLLVGRGATLRAANASLGLPLEEVGDLRAWRPGALCVYDPGDGTETTEVAAIRLGAEACLAGHAHGLITGPIHKRRLAERGFAFRGHTDFLAHLAGARPVMAFVGRRIRLALVTTHMPLSAVPEAISVSEICATVTVAARALRQHLGLVSPRILVCGLNPHAGEEGLLGTEDQDIIAPACARLRAAGLRVEGPMSAEAAFLEACEGQVGLIVAMYHDQGLVGFKALEFGHSVNWTLGLPLIRVSVDHGTADGLVGSGRARIGSMLAALGLARRICVRAEGND